MNILGMGLSHCCGVCLIQDDQIVFAQEEDRFSRNRRQKGWPKQTLAYVLDTFGLAEEDIDLCVLCDLDTAGRMRERIRAKKTIAVHHHLAHVMSGWAMVDYPDFDAISLDGGGDSGSWLSFAVFRDRKILKWHSNCGSRLVRQNRVSRAWYDPRHRRRGRPFGTYWSLPSVVNFGFVDQKGVAGYEGKLMGLAAHGDADSFKPANEGYEARFSTYRANGWHWLRTEGNPKIGDPEFCHSPEGTVSLSELRRLRKEDLKILCEYDLDKSKDKAFAANFAAYLQELTNASVKDLFAFNFTPEVPIVASGGLFANVVVNGLLNQEYQLFVAPPMGDDGLSIGAAAWGAYLCGQRYLKPGHMYLGFDAGSNREVDTREVADLLAGGRIVGLIEGPMEFGPRALGARTILSDARDTNANWTINERLGRVEYMPFAPVVMREHADDVLEGWKASHLSSGHMTLTYQVKPAWREILAGVVHADGSVRPQVIEAEFNPVYYRILSEYHRLTGIPALINTSFNVHGEPMLRTVEHGLEALRDRRVDVLVAGNRLHYGPSMDRPSAQRSTTALNVKRG